MKYSVNNYQTGAQIGSVNLSTKQVNTMKSVAHRDTGAFKADDVLTEAQIEDLGIDARLTIWLD